MGRWLILQNCVLVALGLASFAQAQVTAPKASLTCVACHGPKGISPNPLWPNLAGQKAEYLTKQLNDFREGRRVDPLMSPIAKTLATEDVKVLAAYFSAL